VVESLILPFKNRVGDFQSLQASFEDGGGEVFAGMVWHGEARAVLAL